MSKPSTLLKYLDHHPGLALDGRDAAAVRAAQRLIAGETQDEADGEGLANTVYFLARAAEIYDEGTGNHIRRVNEYSYFLATTIGMDQSFCEELRYSAQLHDLGKISVDPAVLGKTGPLSPAERSEMDNHTVYGHRILSRSPQLAMAAEIALSHHEKWDGTGYPNGLRGEAIPLAARITQIADIYDALRAERPYKPAFDHAAARNIILNGDARIDSAGHFDPRLIEAFGDSHADFERIWIELADR